MHMIPSSQRSEIATCGSEVWICSGVRVCVSLHLPRAKNGWQKEGNRAPVPFQFVIVRFLPVSIPFVIMSTEDARMQLELQKLELRKLEILYNNPKCSSLEEIKQLHGLFSSQKKLEMCKTGQDILAIMDPQPLAIAAGMTANVPQPVHGLCRINCNCN